MPLSEGDFAAVYRRYYRYVVAVARRHLLRPLDAEDVAQEAFCRLLGARDRLAPADNLRAWLAVAARNRAISCNARIQSGSACDPDSLPARPSPDFDTGPVLGRLTATQRHIFLLHYIAGLTALEIADRLDVPVATVRTRIRRALALLRPPPGSDVAEDRTSDRLFCTKVNPAASPPGF